MGETNRANGSDVNFLSDVLLPIFAFVSSANSPQGAAGTQALLSALNVGSQRRARKSKGRREDEDLALRRERQEATISREQAQDEAEQPGRELAAARADFQRGNLEDIVSQINAPGPGIGASREALGAEQTGRLQTALRRGEQVPLPVEAPTPQLRGQRVGEIAATPQGRTQLEAAGLPRIAASGAATAQRTAASDVKLLEVKQAAVEDLRGYTDDLVPPEQRQALTRSILSATTSDELLVVAANLPAGTLKPKSARIEEYKFYANYERQQGRQPVGPLEFQTAQRKAAATRVSTITNVGPSGVNYGTPPKDTTWARNTDGSVALQPYGPEGQYAPVAIPIRGGAAYRAIEEAAEKKQLSQENARQSAAIVVDNLNRGLTIIEDSILPTTALAGSALAYVGGTGANDLSAKLEPVKSRIQIDQLQLIRRASPTGGALGNVSDNEGRLLQSAFGSLRQSQSKVELVYNMNRIREIFLDTLYGVERPDRNLDYLRQEDIAILNKAQEASIEKQRAFYEGRGKVAGPGTLDPSTLTPDDITADKMSEKQLDALEQRMLQQQGTR